jgi:ribose-phosphate pyrophosphokinase
VLSGQAVQKIAASPLESMVVTDTIPLPAAKRIDKIEICSVTQLFADAIRAIHDGSSISRLFR